MPGPARSPDPPDSERHQHHQAETDARRHHTQTELDHVSRLMLGHKPHDHARDHHDSTQHDRDGSRDRQDGDEPHPPGGGGSGAHWSTIASRIPARKPYGQL
jgi:hypothetical protein